jgi:hypothetical protein
MTKSTFAAPTFGRRAPLMAIAVLIVGSALLDPGVPFPKHWHTGEEII